MTLPTRDFLSVIGRQETASAMDQRLGMEFRRELQKTADMIADATGGAKGVMDNLLGSTISTLSPPMVAGPASIIRQTVAAPYAIGLIPARYLAAGSASAATKLPTLWREITENSALGYLLYKQGEFLHVYHPMFGTPEPKYGRAGRLDWIATGTLGGDFAGRATLWEAIKHQMVSEGKKPGTPEFMKELAERWEIVNDQVQPTDNPLSLTGMGKAARGNLVWRLLTWFKSQNFQIANRLLDETGKFRDSPKSASDIKRYAEVLAAIGVLGAGLMVAIRYAQMKVSMGSKAPPITAGGTAVDLATENLGQVPLVGDVANVLISGRADSLGRNPLMSSAQDTLVGLSGAFRNSEKWATATAQKDRTKAMGQLQTATFRLVRGLAPFGGFPPSLLTLGRAGFRATQPAKAPKSGGLTARTALSLPARTKKPLAKRQNPVDTLRAKAVPARQPLTRRTASAVLPRRRKPLASWQGLAV
jgi:hypothetical protein